MFVEKKGTVTIGDTLLSQRTLSCGLALLLSATACVVGARHPGLLTSTAIRIAPPPPGQPSTLHLERDHIWRSHWLHGVASWYGELEDGRLTASGEIFHKAALTACHPTLPFGTLVRVINLRNHRSVVVRINDRGALRPHRVIDLSSAAASAIGLLHVGTAPVQLVVLSRKNNRSAG